MRLGDRKFQSPKRRPSSTLGKEAWYPYYAGYSARFVEDVLEHSSLPDGATVLDPWNGSGTTTDVAQSKGYKAIGCDINPVMIVVAVARSIDPLLLPAIPDLVSQIIESSKDSIDPRPNEPLDEWFSYQTSLCFRSIEQAIQRVFVSDFPSPEVDRRALAAFCLVALFRALRASLTTCKSSNPTWVKKPRSESSKVHIPPSAVRSLFCTEVAFMLDSVLKSWPDRHGHTAPCETHLCSSDAMPLDDSTIDAVISSPPYCTRIDYAVSTQPELALLGIGGEDFENLRRRMIGTPTMSRETLSPKPEWGEVCNKFIISASSHPSKASGTYYKKYFLQYFDSIFRSLQEIGRVLRVDGVCALVVQDSYYKDIHNDLPTIFTEMGANLGWRLLLRQDFCQRSLAGINPKIQKSRRRASRTESVIIFRR